jgi:hypothetical protein
LCSESRREISISIAGIETFELISAVAVRFHDATRSCLFLTIADDGSGNDGA